MPHDSLSVAFRVKILWEIPSKINRVTEKGRERD
jgi:hypothetical protein